MVHQQTASSSMLCLQVDDLRYLRKDDLIQLQTQFLPVQSNRLRAAIRAARLPHSSGMSASLSPAPGCVAPAGPAGSPVPDATEAGAGSTGVATVIAASLSEQSGPVVGLTITADPTVAAAPQAEPGPLAGQGALITKAKASKGAARGKSAARQKGQPKKTNQMVGLVQVVPKGALRTCHVVHSTADPGRPE